MSIDLLLLSVLNGISFGFILFLVASGLSLIMGVMGIFNLAHGALWGASHCVTETLRVTLWVHARHWTAPYVFMKRGRWSCRALSQTLLKLLLARLGI